MKNKNAFDFFAEWIRMPMAALWLKLQNLECAGVEPETVQDALREYTELSRRVNTVLSMLREDEEQRMEAERRLNSTPSILLVDHNPALLDIYGDYLTERGLRVVFLHGREHGRAGSPDPGM